MGRGRETGYINVTVFGAAGKAAATTSRRRGGSSRSTGASSTTSGTPRAGSRHDYQVVGNVEFLTAPRGEQPEQPDPGF